MVKDNNEENPKKKSRLFGGRKGADAAAPESPPVEQPQAAVEPKAPARKRTPAKSASDHVSAAKNDAAKNDAAKSDAAKGDAAKSGVAKNDADSPKSASAEPKATTRRAPAKKAGQVDAAEPVPDAPKTKARPSTSLLFQAPDLPPLPPVAPGAAGDEPGTVRPAPAVVPARKPARVTRPPTLLCGCASRAPSPY